MKANSKTPIHLVLGSGGARGLTHIGVIRVLLEQGFEIRSITGCSMGSLVGALYVSGHLKDYEDWVCSLSRWDVLRFLDISLLGRAGMVKGDKLMERLAEWLSGVDMESLDIPLTVVAADIVSRKEVWIQRGDLLEAVRASIAVPGVFTPLVKHGRILVDGGILNPLPIPPSGMDNTVQTVAVSLSGREVAHPYGSFETLVTQAPEKDTVDVTHAANDSDDEPLEESSESFLDSLQRFFGRERNGVDVDEEELESEAAKSDADEEHRQLERPALTDVMLGMFNTMQDTIARHQLAGNPPDILIDIPCNICESHEFFKANELIPAGEYWARRALGDQQD
ncbi:MAG: patatin-like phospholipase family protein [Pseudomonadota bacterium]